MKYNTAFNMLTEAYIQDKIEPYKNNFCFCGVLNNCKSNWRKGTQDFTEQELASLEDKFLRTLRDLTVGPPKKLLGPGWELIQDDWLVLAHPKYEEALFESLNKTLDLLKEICINKGEIIKEDLSLKQRSYEIQK